MNKYIYAPILIDALISWRYIHICVCVCMCIYIYIWRGWGNILDDHVFQLVRIIPVYAKYPKIVLKCHSLYENYKIILDIGYVHT